MNEAGLVFNNLLNREMNSGCGETAALKRVMEILFEHMYSQLGVTERESLKSKVFPPYENHGRSDSNQARPD